MLAQWDSRRHQPRLVRLREQLLNDGRLDLRVDAGMHDDQTLSLLPQLAVLLGHEKNRVHDALNDEKHADWSLFAGQLLKDYFPAILCRRLASEIEQHPLRMSLAHTCVSNHVLNHNGIISVHSLQSLLDTSVACACEALMMSEQLLNSLPIQAAVQKSHGDARMLKQIQHGIQEYHLQFAEELLRLCEVKTLDQTWLRRQQRGLKAFCKTEAVMGVGGNENSRFLVLLREAVRSGLSKEDSSNLAMLPELAQMAPALYLSTKLHVPLKSALHAMQAVLHLLPFSAIEAPMRSSDWGAGEAHLLRREWFHRLTQLKAKAGEVLLRDRKGQYLEAGETHWSSHRHWASLQEFALESAQQGENNGAATESQRTLLMLMIARLESIIEECV
jgi:glutamate dehydrogenase